MKTSVLIYSTIISFFRIVQMLPIHMFSATNCYFRYFFGEFCFNLCFGSQSKPLIFLVSLEDPLAFAFSNVLATAPPSELWYKSVLVFVQLAKSFRRRRPTSKVSYSLNECYPSIQHHLPSYAEFD